MRILVTIPHYFQARINPEHGSEGSASDRLASLARTIVGLLRCFGSEQAHLENPDVQCNSAIASSLDIIVCTTSGRHLVGSLNKMSNVHHVETKADPRLLGYECHEVLRQNLDAYDFFCYMEDDLQILDPTFFWKLQWFRSIAGPASLLQAHRFETVNEPLVRKLYIDSRLADSSIERRFQDVTKDPIVRGAFLNQELAFERALNPHAGCFFLEAEQMKMWAAMPYFIDRSDAFWGPLESAATLGVMRTFKIYKPALPNAAFFEVQHLDPRYLGKRINYPADYRVARSLFL